MKDEIKVVEIDITPFVILILLWTIIGIRVSLLQLEKLARSWGVSL